MIGGRRRDRRRDAIITSPTSPYPTLSSSLMLIHRVHARLFRRPPFLLPPASSFSTASASATAPSSSSSSSSHTNCNHSHSHSQSCSTSGKSSRSGTAASALSLHHFVQRSRVLSLYRSIIRLTQGQCTLSQAQRKEILEHASTEFRNMRHISDMQHIKQLIAEGSRKKQQLESMIDMTR